MLLYVIVVLLEAFCKECPFKILVQNFMISKVFVLHSSFFTLHLIKEPQEPEWYSVVLSHLCIVAGVDGVRVIP